MRAAEIALTSEQRATLQSWATAGKTEQQLAFRAQMSSGRTPALALIGVQFLVPGRRLHHAARHRRALLVRNQRLIAARCAIAPIDSPMRGSGRDLAMSGNCSAT